MTEIHQPVVPVSSALLDTGTTEYVHAGTGAGLALAHGAGGDVELNFGPLLRRLSGHRHLIGTRYPGTGASHPAGDLDVYALADSLVAALVREGHDRFPVVGASFGSAVALAAALRHPDRVTGLVLTVGFSEADTQLRTVASVWAALDAAGDRQALGAYLISHLTHPQLLARLGESEHHAQAKALGEALPTGGLRQITAATGVHLTDRLPDITVPTLVVIAGADRVVLPSTSRMLAERIPGASLIEYPDAGHAFTEAEGEVWAQDVERFLADHRL
ncbi:pimeloyl-ACP methyl ester carboxylesterase [Streptomyces puniciscabiei]|uniref:Pimeloyl-ACP methyl ester carboxylesterase n=1 Tax=Streptomyces puniciscabiei TaxID=164348 RepID=A0A542SXL8_9ACTN|nr:alpha/beta hydrolase [Streptomyces puniciscabiei]TQK79332.1 pimeloyl-ACP methyl ester carboxylesterase [Streptomyces puniciscabiei]